MGTNTDSHGAKHRTPQLHTRKYYPLQTGSWSRPGTPTPSKPARRARPWVRRPEPSRSPSPTCLSSSSSLPSMAKLPIFRAIPPLRTARLSFFSELTCAGSNSADQNLRRRSRRRVGNRGREGETQRNSSNEKRPRGDTRREPRGGRRGSRKAAALAG